ncbi:MAG: hypothetical protein ACRELY_11375 [Polyangiaceae bacterium]
MGIVCKCAAIGVGIALSMVARPAFADPDASTLRLDALADTDRRGGVVAVQGNAADPWVNAEAYVWSGGWPGSPLAANALTFAFTVHDPKGTSDVRFGRFVYTSGAIRPMELDGASLLVRSPWGTKVETFAGAPVVPAYGARAFEWTTGGRISQMFDSRVTTGVSYVQRREEGDLADEEVGLDLAAAPAKWLDLAARSSYDLTSYGISEAVASGAWRSDGARLEVFASDRSPSRLLPDTSLFSVFGDFPAQSLGSNFFWRAAPRLDVWLGGAAQTVGGLYGGNGSVRALLRTDDKGDGSIGFEARRQDVSTARWTGFRATATRPLSQSLRASSELELVIPDLPQGKGAAWPWGLASLGWHPTDLWEIAGAFQAASTPQHVAEANALVRFSLFLARR